MKKIYSFVFAAIAILSAASCQKEIASPIEDPNAAPFSFVAEREVETKTVLVGKTSHWTVGDKVSAFNSRGEAVSFAGTHKETTASAMFYTPKFAIPEDGTIHAIYPDRAGVSTLNAEGVINNLRVAGSQTAVAGSYDPNYAIGYAKGVVTDPTTPPTLEFKNIHTLFKFTIGGDKAPSKVVLTNGGARYIAGLFTYNTKTGEVTPGNGAKEITLTPAAGDTFKVGETYYISTIGGGNYADITLAFDDTVVKTVEGAKYADKSNNFLLNTIINLGTVAFPVEEPEQPEEPEVVPADVELTKVWSIAAIFGGGADRNMTMDSEYVYVAQAAGGNGAIKAISIADPSVTKEVKIATKVSVSTNGTHAISCVRMLPNNDPAVNNGKDVLVASNLTTGDGTAKLTIYVWTNGIDADPNYFVIDSGTRRLGDKFTVKGTYQSGELWFWDYSRKDNAVIRIAMKDGVAGLWGTPDLAYATGRYSVPVDEGGATIGEVVAHPAATYDADGNPKALLATSNVSYGFVNQSTGNAYALSTWGKDPKLAQTFGYKFFDFNGNNYIAYVQIPSDRNNAVLNVIKDIKGAADFQGTLEAKAGLVTANLLDTPAGNASHGVGDCATVVVDGVRYIAVQGQNMGVALYKLSAIN